MANCAVSSSAARMWSFRADLSSTIGYPPDHRRDRSSERGASRPACDAWVAICKAYYSVKKGAVQLTIILGARLTGLRWDNSHWAARGQGSGTLGSFDR